MAGLVKNVNAILNYAEHLASLPSDLLTMQKPTGNATGNWAKIYFTGEGDIITHGRNYTPVFAGGLKGLVPESTRATDVADNANAKLKFLGNDGNWKELTTAELPIAPNFSIGSDADNGANYIYNAHQVYQHFHEQIAAVDAMKFKGAFDPTNTEGFPKDGVCEIGDTYRVVHSGEYAGYTLNNGDLLICIKEAGSPDNKVTADDVDTFTGNQGEASGEYWMVVEANINGMVQHKVNNTTFRVYTPDVAQVPFNIYAPTTGGTGGQVLRATGLTSVPEWVDQSTLTAGFLTEDLKNTIAGGYVMTGDGTFQLKNLNGQVFGPQYVTSLDNDDWNINIKGQAAGTKNALTLTEGLAFDGTKTSFNGSEATVLSLTPATKAALGGVKIDSRTGSTDSPVGEYTFQWGQSTVSVDNHGMIYLTYANICNALGFEPGNTTAVHNYGIILGSTASDKEYPSGTTFNAESPFFNLTSTNEDGTETTVASSVQFVGNKSIKVIGNSDGTNTNISFELQTATDSYLGGVKVAKNHLNDVNATYQVFGDELNTENKFYGVELDKDGKAFVYVPWKDTGKAFSKIEVTGGGDAVVGATGRGGTIEAADVSSTFKLNAGDGINLIADPATNSIQINQNVWEVVTKDKMGYAPKMVGTETEMTQDYYILSYTGTATNPSWNKLPSGAFKDTWRAITVGGEAFLSNEAIDINGNIVGTTLNITTYDLQVNGVDRTNHAIVTTDAETPGNLNIFASWRDVYVESTKIDDTYAMRFVNSDDLVAISGEINTADQVHEVTFELSWYNFDTQQRETV